MKNLLRLITSFVLVAFSGQLFAAPPTVAGGGGDPTCFPPDTCMPIDNGLIYLAIVGLALGGWLLYSGSKKQA